MSLFKIGDRLQLVGDIARFYRCIVGVVIQSGTYPASVLNQYQVRLGDGTVAMFFDFQLQMPSAIRAQIVVDSSLRKIAGTRGTATSRNVRLIAREVELLLRISGSNEKSIVGQLMSSGSPVAMGLVTLLINDHMIDCKPTDDAGEFEFRDVLPGDITIEVFLPGRRVLAPLTV